MCSMREGNFTLQFLSNLYCYIYEIHKKAQKKEAVIIEIEFITLAIPCRMIGMNSTLMISYIKFFADRLCLQLGYDKIYGDKNPLDFMESILLDLKTNMFEARISDYGLADKTKTEDVFDF